MLPKHLIRCWETLSASKAQVAVTATRNPAKRLTAVVTVQLS